MRESMKRVVSNLIPALVAILFMGPFVYMLIDREPPYIRKDGRVIPEEPYPGDEIEISWDIQTIRVCNPSSPRNVTREIVDKTGAIWSYDYFPSVYGRESAKGDPNQLNRVFTLHPSTAPGLATYRSSACFACNMLQYAWPVCVNRPDIKFTVRDPKDKVKQGQP